MLWGWFDAGNGIGRHSSVDEGCLNATALACSNDGAPMFSCLNFLHLHSGQCGQIPGLRVEAYLRGCVCLRDSHFQVTAVDEDDFTVNALTREQT